MATIDTKIENSLLIVTIIGNIATYEFIEVVLDHYQLGIVKDVIWDLTNGSLQSISDDDFKTIANATKVAVSFGSRRGGKTAFVASTVSDYNRSKFYTVIAEVTGVPIAYSVFRTIDEANDWILG